MEVALIRYVPHYHEVLVFLQRDDLGLVPRILEPHEPPEDLAEHRLQRDGLPLNLQNQDIFRPVGADHELPLGHFTGPIEVHQESVVTRFHGFHVQDGVAVRHKLRFQVLEVLLAFVSLDDLAEGEPHGRVLVVGVVELPFVFLAYSKVVFSRIFNHEFHKGMMSGALVLQTLRLVQVVLVILAELEGREVPHIVLVSHEEKAIVAWLMP